MRAFIMHFSELDERMRAYEETQDYCVPKDRWMVARLDGKGFSKLTQRLEFNKPFDDKFKNVMVKVLEHLMTNTGFKFIYGYTESDEISLLFSFDENTFNRKVRKLNSTLAAYAASEFTLQTRERCAFDCRISELLTNELVEDYFSWRQEDASRNALNGYCYWTLRKYDISARQATSMLNGKGTKFKLDLLEHYGIDYNQVPTWHKRGVGAYFVKASRYNTNPKTGKEVLVKRNVLKVVDELWYQESYRSFINTQCQMNLASVKK